MAEIIQKERKGAGSMEPRDSRRRDCLHGNPMFWASRAKNRTHANESSSDKTTGTVMHVFIINFMAPPNRRWWTDDAAAVAACFLIHPKFEKCNPAIGRQVQRLCRGRLCLFEKVNFKEKECEPEHQVRRRWRPAYQPQLLEPDADNRKKWLLIVLFIFMQQEDLSLLRMVDNRSPMSIAFSFYR